MGILEIETKLQRVRERIAEAAIRSGRPPDAVRLVAITKSHPTQILRAAYEFGQRDFGENRVAEALAKQAELRDLVDVTWHMVGQIQSRKARDVAGHFSYVHSIDRYKIAHRLDQHQAAIARPLSAFLEINASGEDSKAGWNLADSTTWNAFLEEMQPILELPNIRIVGMMTMAPWNAGEQVIRGTFTRLRELRDQLERSLTCKLPELSMGMTDDFEIAIEEGATVVRVGRAIFGPRT